MVINVSWFCIKFLPIIFTFKNQKKKKKKWKGQLRYLFLDLDILSVIKGVLFLSTFFFFICGYLLTTTLTLLSHIWFLKFLIWIGKQCLWISIFKFTPVGSLLFKMFCFSLCSFSSSLCVDHHHSIFVGIYSILDFWYDF